MCVGHQTVLDNVNPHDVNDVNARSANCATGNYSKLMMLAYIVADRWKLN